MLLAAKHVLGDIDARRNSTAAARNCPNSPDQNPVDYNV